MIPPGRRGAAGIAARPVGTGDEEREGCVDDKRFDNVARHLASRATRRGTLRGLLGAGVASVVALAQGQDAGAAPVGAAVCTPDGRPCGKGTGGANPNRLRGCGACCSGFARRVARGKHRCSCRPNGTVANPNRADQCCSGVVGGGRCVDPTPPPPPPPPGPPPPQPRQLAESGSGTISGPDCDPSTAACPFAFAGTITGGTPIAAGTFAGTITVQNLQFATGEGDVAGPVALIEAGTGARLDTVLDGRVTFADDGTGTGVTFSFVGVYRITGGTGRFAGASGAGTATFRGVDPPDLPPPATNETLVTEFTLAGTVTF